MLRLSLRDNYEHLQSFPDLENLALKLKLSSGSGAAGKGKGKGKGKGTGTGADTDTGTGTGTGTGKGRAKGCTLSELLAIYRCLLRASNIAETLQISLTVDTKMMKNEIDQSSSSSSSSSNSSSSTSSSNSNSSISTSSSHQGGLAEVLRCVQASREPLKGLGRLVEELIDADHLVQSKQTASTGSNEGNDPDAALKRRIWKDKWVRVRPGLSAELSSLHEALLDVQAVSYCTIHVLYYKCTILYMYYTIHVLYYACIILYIYYTTRVLYYTYIILYVYYTIRWFVA